MINNVPALCALVCFSPLLFPAASPAAEAGCAQSGHIQRLACEYDLRDDYFTRKAQCLDRTASDDACIEDAATEYDDGLEECNEVLAARLELCDALDDATHDPAFGPAFADSFVDPLQIGSTIAPNPWFPLVPGNRWLYEGEDETIEVVVTSDTKLIDGITCIVVVDTGIEDGVAVEITDDWYAQDLDGNVWYCGEISENYEEFEGDTTAEPELVDIDGSWKAGREGAEAGILLPLEPEPGQIFRQEFAQGDAEDVIEVLATDATEMTPGGVCDGTCLLTRDFTPLEPDAEENKYYVPGLGLILEVDLESGDRVELVEFNGAGS
jgi:hypothetical protein